MTVFGISIVRDEADIIGPIVEHMLGQVDRIIVADNRSRDRTRRILKQFPVEVIDDDEPAHFQSRKMTALAQMAAEEGASWVVPFDGDEWWYSPFGRVGDILEGLAPQWLVASAEVYDQVPTATDPDDADPTQRIKWRRREACPFPKVACRTRDDLVIADGNHGATYNGGATVMPGQLVVRHFPYRSAEQFVRKARNGSQALAATDLPEEIGAHWRGYGRILEHQGEEVLADVFRRHFWAPVPEVDPTLIFDPVPA